MQKPIFKKYNINEQDFLSEVNALSNKTKFKTLSEKNYIAALDKNF